MQGGTGGTSPTQNFGLVGHNAFGPANNWPVCSLVVACKLSLKANIQSTITAFCGFCHKLQADRFFAGISKSLSLHNRHC